MKDIAQMQEQKHQKKKSTIFPASELSEEPVTL
jgi:hypothetical protein